MTQPTERRFVMEPRLDAEVETLNDAIDLKANLTDPRFTDERTPLDNSVTSAKIVNGTIVNADIADGTIQTAKIAGVDGNTTPLQHKRNTHTGWISANPVLAAGEVGFETDTGLSKTGNGTGTWNELSWDAIAHSKQYVKAGESISKGQAVYVSGSDGTDMIVSKASNASEATSSKTFGLMNGTTSSGSYNTVVTEGILGGLNTSAATAGDPVWLGTSGNLIYGLASKPVAPAHLVFIGIVEAAHATAGRIYVKIQNGFEIGELHDVLITTPSNGQALTYDSATSLWKNATPISSLAGLSDVTLTSPVADQVLKYDGTDWVNGTGGGGASVTVSDTAPATPEADALWYDSTDGTLYVYYEDVNGSQWVQVQANSALTAGIESRVGALEASNIAAGTTSPNYLINGAFDFWQRGTSQTTTGYGSADRWYNLCAGTTTVSQETSDLPTGMRYGIKYVTGASSSYAQFHQMFETSTVVPLRGKTVIFSFYAKVAGSYAGNIGAEVQYSSSNTDASYSNNTVAVTVSGTASAPTTWTRMSFTFTVPSDALSLRVGIIPTLAQPSGVTVRVAGAQLELGNVATIFRRNANSIQAELAACQRYFQTSYQGVAAGTTSAAAPKGSIGLYQHTTTAYLYDNVWFPVIMRVAPTVTLYHPSTGQSGHINKDNIGVASYDGTAYASVIGVNGFDVLTSPDSNAAARITYHYTAIAEL